MFTEYWIGHREMIDATSGGWIDTAE